MLSAFFQTDFKMAVLMNCCLICLFSFIFVSEFNHGFEMTLTPTWIREKDQNHFGIRCKVTGQEARSLVSIVVLKDGDELVERKAGVTTVMNKNIRVKSHAWTIGDANGILQNTTLQTFIANPITSDTGVYHCVLTHNDTHGEEVVQDLQSYVVVSDPAISDLEDELNQLKADVEQTANQLSGPFVKHSGKHSVYFVASGGNETIPIPSNTSSRIIFPKVGTNEGNGYDTTTGTFTAPVAGTYAVGFNLELNCKACAFKLRLHTDNKVVHTMMLGHGVEDYNTVVHLESGEKLWLSKYQTISGDHDNVLKSSSTFSVYLLIES